MPVAKASMELSEVSSGQSMSPSKVEPDQAADMAVAGDFAQHVLGPGRLGAAVLVGGDLADHHRLAGAIFGTRS